LTSLQVIIKIFNYFLKHFPNIGVTMKPAALFLALALFATASHAEEPAEQSTPAKIPEIWTASQAVTFALAENPDSSIALKRIEEARAVVAIARSADFPQVNLVAEYGQTNNPMYAFGSLLNQGAYNERIDFNDPGTTDNLQLKARVNYRLYDGGESRAAQMAAEADVEMATADQLGVHQQLAFEVLRAFYMIIQTEQLVRVREESLDAITASLQVGLARFEAGDLLRQDLLNLELQQSVASENLIGSRHHLQLARRGFANLLGLPASEVAVAAGDTQEVPENVDYSKRHELRQLESQEAAARAEIERARSGLLPSLDTFADYQVNQGWTSEESGDSWMAGIRLQYALFDGGNTDSRITLAKVRLQKIQALRKKTELALNLDLEQAQLDYQQARERMAVTDKMVEVAQEAARLSRARFREGVILASDLIDFELRLSDAQARHLAANTGVRTAVANLRRATGLSQFP
jgi:outer membrane protein